MSFFFWDGRPPDDMGETDDTCFDREDCIVWTKRGGAWVQTMQAGSVADAAAYKLKLAHDLDARPGGPCRIFLY